LKEQKKALSASIWTSYSSCSDSM